MSRGYRWVGCGTTGIRLLATGHNNKIEQRLETICDLEQAMNESADQDGEVISVVPFPAVRTSKDLEWDGIY